MLFLDVGIGFISVDADFIYDWIDSVSLILNLFYHSLSVNYVQSRKLKGGL